MALQTDPAVAIRSDDEAGIVETIAFIGPRGGKLFASLHAPSSPPKGGVVVCCSIHNGFELQYRREVLLARSLASQGLAVVRFHYRGTGNSDGHVRDMTFDSMVEDTLSAREWLLERTRFSLPAVLGTGWGGMVAASAAARLGDGPLALWEPLVRPIDYFRDASRARASRDVKEGVIARPSPNLLVEELDRHGRFEVLGYSIDRALHDSAANRTLDDELGDRPRPILLIQMGRGKRPRADYASLTALWRERGCSVETHLIPGEDSWWFVGDRWEPQERRASTVEVLKVSTAWLLAHAGKEAGS